MKLSKLLSEIKIVKNYDLYADILKYIEASKEESFVQSWNINGVLFKLEYDFMAPKLQHTFVMGLEIKGQNYTDQFDETYNWVDFEAGNNKFDVFLTNIFFYVKNNKWTFNFCLNSGIKLI